MGWMKKAAVRKLPAVIVLCAAACALVVIYSDSTAKRRRASSASLDFSEPANKPVSFLHDIVVDSNGAIRFRGYEHLRFLASSSFDFGFTTL